MEQIVFDGREAARPVRQDPKIKPFLADSDDARTGTVTLKDGTPERVINEVAGEAAETREKEATKFGQVPLTDTERDQIDFSETSVPAARSAKGIARGKGVDDFLAFFDETLTVDEHRDVFDRAKKEGAGGAGNRGRETGNNAQRLAQANKRRKAEQGDRIKKFALLETDADAQDELRSMGSIGDVFDIGFSRRDGRLRGSGKDFERLEQRHEQRSERAQRVDERRSAKTTRDPVQWANNPAQYDYPGIDTVQPNELHEQRSERAQEADESELAPPADSKEQWANNQDQYDWPGVDTPPGMALGPNQTRPEPEPDQTDDRPAVGLAVQEGPSTRKEKQKSMMGQLQERDVSLDPDEAFNATGAIGISALGGLDSAGHRDYNEQAPKREPKEPPEPALRRQQRKSDEGIAGDDSDAAGIAFIFENTDTDMGLNEFRRRTKRVGREIGMSDGFGNAQMVANDPDVLNKL